jgi:hypothetical protein
MRSAGRPATLIMGPWTHTNWRHVVGDVNFGFAANSDFMGMRGRVHEMQFDWFRRALGDGEALEPDTGTVLLFVMGINQWREETEWPLSRAVDTDFHLRADGRLTQEPPSTAERAEEFTYDPMDPVPTTGGALLLSDEFRPGPLDQTAVEGREDVLVFTTEPLTEAVEVTGRVRAVLFAATDGPSTDWVARLCDVDENGVSRNVADGIVRVRAAHRARRPSTSWTCGRPASSSGRGTGYGSRSPPATSPAGTATSTRASPRKPPPRPGWRTSRSSTIPPGRRASSCPWCLQPDRERGESPPIRCSGGQGRRSSHVGSVEGRQAPCGGGDDLPRAPAPR